MRQQSAKFANLTGRGTFAENIQQALDAEFVGSAGSRPQVVRALAREGVVMPEAVEQAELLWTFVGQVSVE